MSCYRTWELAAKRIDGNALTEEEVKRIRDYIDDNLESIYIDGSWYDHLISSFETESNFVYEDVRDEMKQLSEEFPYYVFEAEEYCWDNIDMYKIIAYQGNTEKLDGWIEYAKPTIV